MLRTQPSPHTQTDGLDGYIKRLDTSPQRRLPSSSSGRRYETMKAPSSVLGQPHKLQLWSSVLGSGTQKREAQRASWSAHGGGCTVATPGVAEEAHAHVTVTGSFC